MKRCVPHGPISVTLRDRNRIDITIPGCGDPECHEDRHAIITAESARLLADQLVQAASVADRLAQTLH